MCLQAMVAAYSDVSESSSHSDGSVVMLHLGPVPAGLSSCLSQVSPGCTPSTRGKQKLWSCLNAGSLMPCCALKVGVGQLQDQSVSVSQRLGSSSSSFRDSEAGDEQRSRKHKV